MMGLLRALVRDSGMVMLINNGGLEQDADRLLALSDKVRIINPGSNVGMANALNLSFNLADQAGFSHLVSFDQDSNLNTETLNTLIDDFNHLERAGEKVAAVGPRFYDPRANDAEASQSHAEMSGASGLEREARPYIITSGCLASVAAWRESAGFDEKLFIDLVDIEWCWRLATLHYKVFVSKDAVMAHRLSNGMKVVFKTLRFNTYGYVRRFYMARNSCYLLFFKPWNHAQRVFLIKSFIFSAVSAVVSDEEKIKSIKGIARGCLHAFRGRMGKYVEEGK